MSADSAGSKQQPGNLSTEDVYLQLGKHPAWIVERGSIHRDIRLRPSAMR